ncbi:hypothetical protein AB4874_16060 [Thioclava sp. 15-R06ZXC-3]|uniref:Histidine kinase n=1 Tax=Thioclava arctica TaxID=3238301 RepID=A0ABV3TNE7_9RHOB
MISRELLVKMNNLADHVFVVVSEIETQPHAKLEQVIQSFSQAANELSLVTHEMLEQE